MEQVTESPEEALRDISCKNDDIETGTTSSTTSNDLRRSKYYCAQQYEVIKKLATKQRQTEDRNGSDPLQPKILLEKLQLCENGTSNPVSMKLKDSPNSFRVPRMENGEIKDQVEDSIGVPPPLIPLPPPPGNGNTVQVSNGSFHKLKTPSSCLNKRKPYRAARSDADTNEKAKLKSDVGDREKEVSRSAMSEEGNTKEKNDYNSARMRETETNHCLGDNLSINEPEGKQGVPENSIRVSPIQNDMDRYTEKSASPVKEEISEVADDSMRVGDSIQENRDAVSMPVNSEPELNISNTLNIVSESNKGSQLAQNYDKVEDDGVTLDGNLAIDDKAKIEVLGRKRSGSFRRSIPEHSVASNKTDNAQLLRSIRKYNRRKSFGLSRKTVVGFLNTDFKIGVKGTSSKSPLTVRKSRVSKSTSPRKARSLPEVRWKSQLQNFGTAAAVSNIGKTEADEGDHLLPIPAVARESPDGRAVLEDETGDISHTDVLPYGSRSIRTNHLEKNPGGSLSMTSRHFESRKIGDAYLSEFDKFLERDLNRSMCDETEDRFMDLRRSDKSRQIHVYDNKIDNIFEKFRSSLPPDDTSYFAECLDLSRTREDSTMENAESRRSGIFRERDHGGEVTVNMNNMKEISELFGDYDSDSTECCKYEYNDQFFPDNPMTGSGSQLDGLLTRSESFYPGFSPFHVPSDSDDNLVVDESIDYQAVEPEVKEAVKCPEEKEKSMDSDDDHQFKKLRSNAYRTYTRKTKLILLQKRAERDEMEKVNPSKSVKHSGGHRTVDDTEERPTSESVDLVETNQLSAEDQTVAVRGGKRRPRSSKKPKLKSMKRKKNQLGGKSSPATTPSKQTAPSDRKKVSKKLTRVRKDFVTRSRTRKGMRDPEDGQKKEEGSGLGTTTEDMENIERKSDEKEDSTISNEDRNAEGTKATESCSGKKLRNGGFRRQGRMASRKESTKRAEKSARKKPATVKNPPEADAPQPPKVDILRHELGPRYNWLEQKIQAMQRGFSCEEGVESPSTAKIQCFDHPPAISSGPPSRRPSNGSFDTEEDFVGPKVKRRPPVVERQLIEIAPRPPAESDHGRQTTGGNMMDHELHNPISRSIDDLGRLESQNRPPDAQIRPSNATWSIVSMTMSVTSHTPASPSLVASLDMTSKASHSSAAPQSVRTPPILMRTTMQEITPEPTQVTAAAAAASICLAPYPDARRSSASEDPVRRQFPFDLESQHGQGRPRSLTNISRTSDMRHAAGVSPSGSNRSIPIDQFHAEHEGSPQEYPAAFDLTLSSVRNAPNTETMALQSKHTATSCAGNNPDSDQAPLPLTHPTMKYNEGDYKTGYPPLPDASRMQNPRKQKLDPDAVVESIIDLTSEPDPVLPGFNSSEMPPQHQEQMHYHPHPTADAQRPGLVLRSIRYEYGRILEMYERLSRVSKIKDQEIAVLENERMRMRKELNYLKNVVNSRASGTTPDDNNDGDRMVGVAEDSTEQWQNVDEVSGKERRANEAHRRETSVRLLAGQAPPEAHSLKTDLSMYSSLKCQYKEKQSKGDSVEAAEYNARITDYIPESSSRDVEAESRASSHSSAGHRLPYRASAVPDQSPDQVPGPNNESSAYVVPHDTRNSADPRRRVQASVQYLVPDTDRGIGRAGDNLLRRPADPANFDSTFSRQRFPQAHLKSASERTVVDGQSEKFDHGQVVQQQSVSRRPSANLPEPAQGHPGPTVESYAAEHLTKPLPEFGLNPPPVGSAGVGTLRQVDDRRSLAQRLSDSYPPNPNYDFIPTEKPQQQQHVQGLVALEDERKMRRKPSEYATMAVDPGLTGERSSSAGDSRRLVTDVKKPDPEISEATDQCQAVDLSCGGKTNRSVDLEKSSNQYSTASSRSKATENQPEGLGVTECRTADNKPTVSRNVPQPTSRKDVRGLEDMQTVDFSQSQYRSSLSRDRKSADSDGAASKMMGIGKTDEALMREVPGLVYDNKPDIVFPEKAGKEWKEKLESPVDTKAATAGRGPPVAEVDQRRMGSMITQQSPTDLLSVGSHPGFPNDGVKNHSGRSVNPDAAQQRLRVMEIAEAAKMESEKAAGKDAGSASDSRKDGHRKWLRHQRSIQPKPPDSQILNSNLQDMSSMVNSIAAGQFGRREGEIVGKGPLGSAHHQLPVEKEQRTSAPPEMAANISPNCSRVTALRYAERGERRPSPQAPYPTDLPPPPATYRKSADGALSGYPNPALPPESLPTMDMEAHRFHAREAAVGQMEKSSSGTATLQQRLNESQVAVHPHPFSQPVPGQQRESAFAPVELQRREPILTRHPVEQTPVYPRNDPGRHGNAEHLHPRAPPGNNPRPHPQSHPPTHVPPAAPHPPPLPPLPPRHGDGKPQPRLYSGMPMLPGDVHPGQPMIRNDRIPLPVFQKSEDHAELALQRVPFHRGDQVPSSDVVNKIPYGVMLHSRPGAHPPRENAAMAMRSEEELLLVGQPRNDGPVMGRFIRQDIPVGPTWTEVGFQDPAGGALRGNANPAAYAHHVPGSDGGRTNGWRVAQVDYPGSMQVQGQEKQKVEGSHVAPGRYPDERVRLLEQHHLMASGGMESLNEIAAAAAAGQKEHLRLHPFAAAQINARYLPTYIESIAAGVPPSSLYRNSGVLLPSPQGPTESNKDDPSRVQRQQGRTHGRAPPNVHPDKTQVPVFSQSSIVCPPPPSGILNPHFASGSNNPGVVQMDRLQMRARCEQQKRTDPFSARPYPGFDRPPLMNGRPNPNIPTTMTSSTARPSPRQEEFQPHPGPIKANQVPIQQPPHDAYKQQHQQQQQQQQQLAGQKSVDYICDVCRKPAMFVCSACKGVAYCSTECQAISWQTKHSTMCRQL